MEFGELSFKVVRLEPGGQEVLVRAGNYEICKAAFDKALFVYPTGHLELRQGARVILKSKEEPSAGAVMDGRKSGKIRPWSKGDHRELKRH